MSQQSSNLKSRVTAVTLAPLVALGLAGSADAAEAASERALRAEASIKASPAEVWRAWTTSDGAQTFFAPKANIRLDVGGPYEIYFNPGNDRMSTKGMKVLSFAPEQMISFQWNSPGDIANLPGDGTWVVVELRPEGVGCDPRHVEPSRLEERRGL